MIRDRERDQSTFDGEVHQLFRRQRTVTEVRVRVEVQPAATRLRGP
jgi:hypothetical protein